MTESKADTATTPKAPAAPAAASAAEGEKLPTPAKSKTPKPRAEKPEAPAGDPFIDAAPPVGAALEKLTEPEEIDVTVDFPTTEAFTITEGDVQVAVVQVNQRNIVQIAPAGWVGPGQVFAPYQAKLLHKALGQLIKKLK